MTLNKFIKLFVTAGFVLLACSCRLFPPPKDEYQSWSQSGKTYLDVKKSLLECGFSSPYFGDYYQSQYDFLSSAVCMERLGYIRVSKGDINPICANGWTKDETACQWGAAIPSPSVERRLNSLYCKSTYYHNRQECQP
jgi:hypothetical protein